MDQIREFSRTSGVLLPDDEDGRPIQGVQAVKSSIKYCLYARKSTEDDERQALSIDSQIKEMKNQSLAQELDISEVRTESHSAKATGMRPVFNQLIADIRNGEFSGIVSWAPDRLSRNAGDLGAIVDLMDNGYLREIRTHGQIFTNSPNDKFLLMILCSQAKLENDHRGENVKRGMKTKCEMGYRPNMTPLGYLNDKFTEKGLKKVYPDPGRAPIIKQAFKKIAHEGYSGRKIFLWLRDEANLRSRTGRVIPLSAVYRMLDNPYYCGIFESPVGSGKWYKGSYEPVISKELFREVQKKMVVAPKAMPNTKKFNFTKMIKCGNCGSGITAQERIKRGKSYIYYHCTKLKDFSCHEPYITEKNLRQEFIMILDQVPVEKFMANKSIKLKFLQFQRFNSPIIEVELKDNETNDVDMININFKKFIRHVLEDCPREDKRELIDCINATFYLKDRGITAK